MNSQQDFNRSVIRTAIECGLIGICCGSAAMLTNIYLTPPRLTLIGRVALSVYGGFTGGIVGTSLGALATASGYGKRYPWLLRLVTVAASALLGAVNIPFTLPREFFDQNP
jgi:hypothetical protein